MTIDTGGPAFPASIAADAGEWRTGCEFGLDGMSLRDYFAAMAMQAYFADRIVSNWATHAPVAATAAYILADAMLAERKR